MLCNLREHHMRMETGQSSQLFHLFFRGIRLLDVCFTHTKCMCRCVIIKEKMPITEMCRGVCAELEAVHPSYLRT